MFFPFVPDPISFSDPFDWRMALRLTAHIAFILALLSIPSVVMKRRGRPQSALSWVLILLTVPILGLFLWWAIGRTHLARKRKKKRKAAKIVSQKLDKLLAPEPKMKSDWQLFEAIELPPDDAEWVFPATRGDHVQLLENAEQAYPALEALIENAKHHIHCMFYIWNRDDTGRRFRDLLVEKARQGVEVRVLLDAFGASKTAGRFMDPLREAGGEVRLFGRAVYLQRNLEFNFRNHRKLLIADAQDAILGGLNIGDNYKHEWRDMALHLQGPVLDQLQEVFVEDWAYAKGKDFIDSQHFGRWQEAPRQTLPCPVECAVVASGPHTDSSLNLTHEAFFMTISQARERVWLTTPYFVPDSPMMAALRTAVFRGVDVRLLLPEKSDAPLVSLASRSYYPALLRSGVRISEYRNGFMHAKTAVIDDDLAFVGSANLDVRSFRLNFELSCFLKSKKFCERLADSFQRDLKQSREVTKSRLEKRSYFKQLSEAFAHLLSPLM